MSHGLTPEFALGYRAMMLDGINREAQTTRRVIAAIPDDKSDYKPDPHARTAKELAWHLANSDIQFLDGIADMSFSMDTPEHKPQTAAEIAAELGKRGVLCGPTDKHSIRMVTHCDVDREAIEQAIQILRGLVKH